MHILEYQSMSGAGLAALTVRGEAPWGDGPIDIGARDSSRAEARYRIEHLPRLAVCPRDGLPAAAGRISMKDLVASSPAVGGARRMRRPPLRYEPDELGVLHWWGPGDHGAPLTDRRFGRRGVIFDGSRTAGHCGRFLHAASTVLPDRWPGVSVHHSGPRFSLSTGYCIVASPVTTSYARTKGNVQAVQ